VPSTGKLSRIARSFAHLTKPAEPVSFAAVNELYACVRQVIRDIFAA
jgi:hypothetical protein